DHIRRQVYTAIQAVAANLKTTPGAPDLTPTEKEQLLAEVLEEVFRLGPLEPLLQDPTISDILVNGAQEVYIERAGVLEESRTIFKDNTHLMHIIDRIVSAVGRRVDESSPMVDARLADGSRVHVIIPPLAIDGPILSIRRFAVERLGIADLLRLGTLTEPVASVLKAVVLARLNVLIS